MDSKAGLSKAYITAKTFELLQPHFRLLSCISVTKGMLSLPNRFSFKFIEELFQFHQLASSFRTDDLFGYIPGIPTTTIQLMNYPAV